jgi:hypothetical protein
LKTFAMTSCNLGCSSREKGSPNDRNWTSGRKTVLDLQDSIYLSKTIQKRVIRAWIPTRIYVKMVILRTVLAKEVAVFSALEK